MHKTSKTIQPWFPVASRTPRSPVFDWLMTRASSRLQRASATGCSRFGDLAEKTREREAEGLPRPMPIDSRCRSSGEAWATWNVSICGREETERDGRN